MTQLHPAPPLMQAIELDEIELLKHDWVIQHDWVTTTKSFIEHNECGLAYDCLVSAIEKKIYLPSASSLELIKLAGKIMGIKYPNSSC